MHAYTLFVLPRLRGARPEKRGFYMVRGKLAWVCDFRCYEIDYPHTKDLFLLSSGMGVNYFRKDFAEKDSADGGC